MRIVFVIGPSMSGKSFFIAREFPEAGFINSFTFTQHAFNAESNEEIEEILRNAQHYCREELKNRIRKMKDDDVIAACLAHDMVEDSDLALSDLPVNDRVREVIRLVSWNTYDESRPDLDDVYYESISKNPLACLVKCLDRCNNLAGMADCFSRRKMAKYTAKTDRYFPALLEVVKKVPEWNDAWWLLRYQMMTLTEAFKRLL